MLYVFRLEMSHSLVRNRGLAGTVLIHKISGALSQEGASLDEVENVAKYIADNTATYGVGLEHCHVRNLPSRHGVNGELISVLRFREPMPLVVLLSLTNWNWVCRADGSCAAALTDEDHRNGYS